MKRDIITSAIGIIVFTLFCGLVYPLFITGVSQVAFPGNANGQKVYVNGQLSMFSRNSTPPSFNGVEAMDIVKGPGSAVYGPQGEGAGGGAGGHHVIDQQNPQSCHAAPSPESGGYVLAPQGTAQPRLRPRGQAAAQRLDQGNAAAPRDDLAQ